MAALVSPALSMGPLRPLAESPDWFSLLVLIWLAVFVVLGAAALFGALYWMQRRGLRRLTRVEISNLGNVRCRYGLRANDPTAALTFRFVLNGIELTSDPIDRPNPAPPNDRALATPVATGNGRQLVPAHAPPPSEGAPRAARRGPSLTNVIASIGEFLPGLWGARVRHAAGQARHAQYSVESTRRLANWVGPGAATEHPPDPGAAHGDGPAAESLAGAPAVAPDWALTPFVEPGEKLAIDLLITPLRSSQTQRYSFRLVSAAMDIKDATPVIEAGSVEIKGISALRLILIGLIVLLLAVAVFLALRWLLMLFGVLA